MVTATISSTSAAPPSRICMAASMAWVSNWFSVVSPERSRRLEPWSMRFSTAASGTSFTRTQIFTNASPWSPCRRPRRRRRMLPTPLTDESIGAGNSAENRPGSGSGCDELRHDVALAGNEAGLDLDRGLPLDLLLADQPQGRERPRHGEDPAEHEDLVEPGEEALAGGVRDAGARARRHRGDGLVEMARGQRLHQLTGPRPGRCGRAGRDLLDLRRSAAEENRS